MDHTARDFLQLAIDAGALRFGSYQLKSGRTSPYFFNAGAFSSGAQLARLGQLYAQRLLATDLQFDGLFGPAYKGIPLVAATAVQAALLGRDLPYCFNRKEAKDHGEGGLIVGAALAGRIVIVDDVITAGTAIREAITLITDAGAQVAAVVVALDRQERGRDHRSARQELEQSMGFPVLPVATLLDLLDFSADSPSLQAHRPALQAYRDQYGVT